LLPKQARYRTALHPDALIIALREGAVGEASRGPALQELPRVANLVVW
jgi:hypothetical protein